MCVKEGEFELTTRFNGKKQINYKGLYPAACCRSIKWEGKLVRYLVIEDEIEVASVLSDLIEMIGGKVFHARTASEAFEIASTYNIDIALVDLMLPDRDGIEVIAELKKIRPEAFFIVITSVYETGAIVRAVKEGASEYINKPFEVSYLKNVLTTYQELVKLRKKEKGLKEEVPPLEEIMGQSSKIEELKRLIREVAPFDTTVLLTGQTGVGKGLVARVIHRLSKRSEGPFVVLDCASLPDTLMEAELCGYRKGAFTGADRDKEGLVEIADGGTLFIDEIGELPLHLQPKLLRIIDEGVFRRIGDTRERRVDVRVVSATNRDLKAMVREGRFRNDLYYRLDVVNIYVPSLSERADDVWLLANYFLCHFAGKMGKRIKGFSKESEKFLLSYHWPGNVRELKNLIERAVVMTEDEWIKPSDFHAPQTDSSRKSFDFPRKIVPLKTFERDYIKYVLKKTGNNKSKAARLLGISRNTLKERLKD